MDDCDFFYPGCSLESAERTSTQVTRRANRKKRLTVLYMVEHPNQEGDACIDWTSQYCWTNGWNCLWRGHTVYRNRPLIPHRNRPWCLCSPLETPSRSNGVHRTRKGAADQRRPHLLPHRGMRIPLCPQPSSGSSLHPVHVGVSPVVPSLGGYFGALGKVFGHIRRPVPLTAQHDHERR